MKRYDEKYKIYMKSTQIYSELNQITKQKSKIQKAANRRTSSMPPPRCRF
jgi:hypothetical protein